MATEPPSPSPRRGGGRRGRRLAYVLGQATDAGLDVDDAQVAVVLDAERAYLEAIGRHRPRGGRARAIGSVVNAR